ncbi:MAG: RsmE family RNA methyltransferase [Bacteroidota bacterium]
MEWAFLSDVELYYTNQPVIDNSIRIEGEECHHIVDVMRHKVGDEIFITDGFGVIYQSNISAVEKKKIIAGIIDSKKYENKFSNVWFCVPRLKSAERFEFALEKSVELGITNFIVFDSKRTVTKGAKIERWRKILLAAMKQSLRAWLPNISYAKSIYEIANACGEKIFFDQNASQTFQQFLSANTQSILRKSAKGGFGPSEKADSYYFLFGPEGGFTEEELKTCLLCLPDRQETGKMANSVLRIRLTENRLRSETAIVTAASILSTYL